MTLGEVKRSYITKLNFKINFKVFFIPTVLTNKIYETHLTELSVCRLGHAPLVGLGGTDRSKT